MKKFILAVGLLSSVTALGVGGDIGSGALKPAKFLKTFPNGEKIPYLAGKAHYSNVHYFELGDQTPITEQIARNSVIQVLADICSQQSLKLDPNSYAFEYSNEHNTGGADIGDVILHPILATKSRAIVLEAQGQCSDGTKDASILALKSQDQNLFISDRFSLSNTADFSQKELTVRFSTYKLNAVGSFEEVTGPALPKYRLTESWISAFGKDFEVESPLKIVEEHRAEQFFKLDSSKSRNSVNSFSTYRGYNLFINNVRQELQIANPVKNGPSWWNLEKPSQGDFKNGVAYQMVTDVQAGIIDIRVFLNSDSTH